jgi:hypothetical protein
MEAAGSMVLQPRLYNYTLVLFGGPFALISILTIGWVLLTLLGFDTGAHFEKEPNFTTKEALILLAVLMVFLFLLGFIASAAWLVGFVRFSKGRILPDQGFVLRPLFGRWRTFSFQDFSGYSECSFPTWARRRGQGVGIAMYGKDGSHIQINDTMVFGLDDFVSQLEKHGVPYIGSELCWWWPFMKRRFKFDPK